MSVYLAHIETVTLYVTCMSVYLAHIETEPCKKLKCHLALRARWQINMVIINMCTKNNEICTKIMKS